MEFDENKFDTILLIQPSQINEDERLYGQEGTKGVSPVWRGSGHEATPDPTISYDTFSFGRVVRQSLQNMGDGYYNKITDFGKYIIITIGYHNLITGRDSEKTYLIVFHSKGDGIVMSTSNRYRTINGVSQAISYMKSSAQGLKNYTSSRS